MDSGYGGVIALFVNRVLQGKPPIIYGDGKQTRDYLYIDDAVAAYDLVLNSNGNPAKNGLNFGSGSEISVNEIANLIINGVHAELRPIHIEARPVEVQRLFADISKAKESLGFEPKFEFSKGISVLINWYENYKSELWLY